MRFRELPRYRDWLSVGFLGITLVGGIAGSFISKAHGSISENTLKTVSTVLLTSEAAIFAVAFTVTLIGVELKSSELSSRVSWIFTRVWIFRRTFQVFAIAFLLNVICLLSAGAMVPWQRTASATVISVVGALSLLMIYFYLIEAIEKLTPGGVVDIFSELLTPRTYISEVTERKGRVVNEHPLDALFDVVVELNTDGDDDLGELSIKTYFEIVGDVMEYSLYTPSEDLRLQQFLVPHINHSAFLFLQTERNNNPNQMVITSPELFQFYEVLTTRYGELGGDLFEPVYNSHLSKIMGEVPNNEYGEFFDEMDFLLDIAIKNRSKLLVNGLFDAYWTLHDDSVSNFDTQYKIESRILKATHSCVDQRGLIVGSNQLETLAKRLESDQFQGEDLYGPVELYTTKAPEIFATGLSWYSGELNLLRHQIKNPNRYSDLHPDVTFIITYNQATARIIHAYYGYVETESRESAKILIEFLRSNIETANEANVKPEVEYLIEQFIHAVCLLSAQTKVKVNPEDQLRSLIKEEPQFKSIINQELGKLSRNTQQRGLSNASPTPTLHINIPDENIDVTSLHNEISKLRTELTPPDQQPDAGET